VNLEMANTRAFAAFHRFHEHLNRTIKTSVIAYALLDEAIKSGVKKSELDMKTIRAGGLWGGMPDWTNPPETLAESKIELGASFLVRVFSAFDLFIEHLVGELSSWTHFRSAMQPESTPKAEARRQRRKKGAASRELSASLALYDEALDAIEDSPAIDDADVEKVSRIYARFGWRPTSTDFFLPIYRYYRLCRNCVAHRDGRASAALVESSEKAQWRSTVRAWSKTTGEESVPRLREYSFDARIELDHRDVILASSMLRRIAVHMNGCAVHELGPLGMVYFAARRSLLESPPSIPTTSTKSAVKVIHEALHLTYRVNGLSETETIAYLEDIGIWRKCRLAFDKRPPARRSS
jgi:hypothetical protein